MRKDGTTHFTDFLSSVRKICRRIVLPSDKIKIICKEYLSGKNISSVLDFGSGTLFWSEWFASEFNCIVYAVDSYYENYKIPDKENIIYHNNINKFFDSCSNLSVIWVCDVLHHLSEPDYNKFLKQSIKKSNIVIIKDIDRNHKFGNFMNKMHDKIINREEINNIDPNKIKGIFENNGFETFYYYLPKMWYPHFLIVGIKMGEKENVA
jgi:2-polyprenyl-3-methyl-5-hydroxy-6-metoxy-1,4-benzoquinol methylase